MGFSKDMSIPWVKCVGFHLAREVDYQGVRHEVTKS